MKNGLVFYALMSLFIIDCIKAQEKDYYIVYANGDTLFTDVKWVSKYECSFKRKNKKVTLPADSLTSVKYETGFCRTFIDPKKKVKRLFFHYGIDQNEVSVYYSGFGMTPGTRDSPSYFTVYYLHFRHKSEPIDMVHRVNKRELLLFDYTCQSVMKDLLKEVDDRDADKYDDDTYYELIRKYNVLCEVQKRIELEK